MTSIMVWSLMSPLGTVTGVLMLSQHRFPQLPSLSPLWRLATPPAMSKQHSGPRPRSSQRSSFNWEVQHFILFCCCVQSSHLCTGHLCQGSEVLRISAVTHHTPEVVFTVGVIVARNSFSAVVTKFYKTWNFAHCCHCTIGAKRPITLSTKATLDNDVIKTLTFSPDRSPCAHFSCLSVSSSPTPDPPLQSAGPCSLSRVCSAGRDWSPPAARGSTCTGNTGTDPPQCRR